MPSRLPELRQLLGAIKGGGYEFITVEELATRLLSHSPLPQRACVLRCDIDSDVATARSMFDTLEAVGAKGSWYYRLCTLDPCLMGDMQAAGHEVGYHFEELATVAKRRGISRKDQIERHFQDMQEEFCRNIETRYRPAAGTFPKTICSHGDFANRFLKQTSSCLVTPDIRTKYGIIADNTDAFMKAVCEPHRYADVSAPRWWYPSDPINGVRGEGEDLLYILVHPRQWRKHIAINTYLEVERIADDLRYRVNRWRATHA